jgi:hypothetical protein
MATFAYRELINRDLPPFERGCSSKVLYLSRREARSAARGGRRTPGLVPYHCQWFEHWHLGHRRPPGGHP